MPHTASTAQVPLPLPYASAHARDIARAGIEDLASVSAVWAALHAVERAALPLAPQELAYVAARNSSVAHATTAQTADEGSDDANSLSPFLSSAVPAITFPRYALHVAEVTGYGHTGLAVGLGLMGRYAAVSGRGVTPLSMHRLFATSMQLGMKTASDIFVKNVYVAPLVGMTLVELNVLECALATALDFRSLVTPAELTSLPRALADLEQATTTPMADVQAVFTNMCSVAPPPPLPQPPVPAAAPEIAHPGWTPANGLVELYAPGGSQGPRRRDSGGSSVNALPSSTGTSARGAPERGASERGGASGFGSMVRGPMSFSVLPGATTTTTTTTAPGVDVASAAPPAAAGAAAP